MKIIVKKIVCIFLCLGLICTVIDLPEKVSGETATDSVLYRYMGEQNEKYGFVNKNGKIVVKAIYDEVGKFSDGLAVVRKGSKSGYIDTTGKIVIPLQYESASDVSDGLAVVGIKNKCYFIKTNGEQAFDSIYTMAYEFSDGLAPVKIKDKFGYINTNGELVIPAKYNWAYPFSEQRAFVIKGDYKLVIDTEGKTITKYADDTERSDFSDGYAIIQKKGKYGYINKDGKVVIKPSSKWYYVEHFSEGLAVYWEGPKSFESGYGYINKKGKIAIKPIYSQAYDFSEGLACVQNGKTYKYGFINKKGKQVIKCQYDYALSFENGLACVWKDGKTYMIDKKGKRITIK